MVSASDRIARLSPDQIGALARRLRHVRGDPPSTEILPIAAGERPALLPLSYSQERLWLLERIERPGSAYNLTAGVRLEGGFDDHAFKLAVLEVITGTEFAGAVFGCGWQPGSGDRPGRIV